MGALLSSQHLYPRKQGCSPVTLVMILEYRDIDVNMEAWEKE